MKIMELNEKELMTIDGGAKKPNAKKDCKRDWGGVASGAGQTLAGGIGYVGTLFGDDGDDKRIKYIREGAAGLITGGWNQMKESYKCKNR